MLSSTARKVAGLLAYLCWNENMLKLCYDLGNANGSLALNIIVISEWCCDGKRDQKKPKFGGTYMTPLMHTGVKNQPWLSLS